MTDINKAMLSLTSEDALKATLDFLNDNSDDNASAMVHLVKVAGVNSLLSILTKEVGEADNIEGALKSMQNALRASITRGFIIGFSAAEKYLLERMVK